MRTDRQRVWPLISGEQCLWFGIDYRRNDTVSAVVPASILYFIRPPQMWCVESACVSCSGYAKELLEKVLRAASNSEALSFFCFLCNVPHKAPPHGFKSLAPPLHVSGDDPLPTLHVTALSGAQTLDAMELASQGVVKLLQSRLNSGTLVGDFFIECLKHLNVVISSNGISEQDENTRKGTTITDDVGTLPGTNPGFYLPLTLSPQASSSSVLLACEAALPMSSSELSSGTSLLHCVAALCECLSGELLSQCHLPSLLAACGAIMARHAAVLERVSGGVTLSIAGGGPVYEEEVLGGSISLSTVLGLVSAVMAGARKVS